MKKKQKLSPILEDLKLKVKGLNSEEVENFRDNLLAYLLFGDQSSAAALPENETLKGISDQERALIKKLAAQTEELFKVMNKKNDGDN